MNQQIQLPSIQELQAWTIYPSSKAANTAEEISSLSYNDQAWYPAKTPGTVLSTLITNHVIENPFFGMNLNEIPTEPYQSSWWYRTTFFIKEQEMDRNHLLEFDGINYKANIWINGRLLAGEQQVKGAFRRFSFNIQSWIKPGNNVIAIEVHPPQSGDYTMGFVDWNPPAPDQNMGLWRPVRIRQCGNLSLENPFVRTLFPPDNYNTAGLVITFTAVNHSDKPLIVYIKAKIQGKKQTLTYTRRFEFNPAEIKEVEFTWKRIESFQIKNPDLWWPYTLGTPNLYSLKLQIFEDKGISDTTNVTFGIRHVEDYFTPEGHRGFRINGKNILITGGGWTDDLLLADTPETIEAQLQYVKHINLNSIRLEGIWGKDQTLYDLCDRYGILIMAGWSCHWEHSQYLGKDVDERFGGITEDEDIDLISHSWEDQVVWLRNHPSIYVWAVASDKVPSPALEQKYLDTFYQKDPTRPYLCSTGGFGSDQKIICKEEIVSEISGESGMKMLGPYDYTPPVYWYIDKKLGGAFGFNTETGPGAIVPVLDSLKKMFPVDHRWPVDVYWNFHCCLNEFNKLDRFLYAMKQRYGEPSSLEDFAYKSQVLNYELMRPMFEAFRANKGHATGIIQWMLNSAWPKLYWQLYDYYLAPTGAFYATRTSCKPLHVLYNYGDQGIYIVNDVLQTYENMELHIRVFDIHSSEIVHEQISVNCIAEISGKVYSLQIPEDITTAYFLDLRLYDKNAKEIDRNFYWLSTKPDVLDFDVRVEPWPFYTPSKEYADFSLLNMLPKASISVIEEWREEEEKEIVIVILKNTSPHLAFFIELCIRNEQGEMILPVFWDDNYVSLLPNEERAITGWIYKKSGKNVVQVKGWNCPQFHP